MRKLNNKGVVTVLTIYLWANAALIGSSVMLTPSFRERKAMEYCQAEGGSATFCKQTVAGMSKEDVLAYIKDTQEQPR